MDKHPDERSLFLASIDPADLAAMQPHFRDVVLHHDAVLCAVGDLIDYVYFPTHGMVSVLTVMEDGRAIETGVVGREGIVCAAVIGCDRAVHQSMVQIPGAALRLPSTIFLSVYDGSRSFRRLVNRQNTMMWALAQQCAACNALHPLPARLARWLLQTRDRVGNEDLKLTQEFLGMMLGVQRTSVTLAERTLEEDGLIDVRRGRVRILDADALTQRACECYRADRERNNLGREAGLKGAPLAVRAASRMPR